jgi:anti-sigma factor RsiW
MPGTFELEREPLHMRVDGERPAVTDPVRVSSRVADAPDHRHHRRPDAQQAGFKRREEHMILVSALGVERHQRVDLGVRQQAVRQLPRRRDGLVTRLRPSATMAPLPSTSAAPTGMVPAPYALYA